MLNLSKLLYLKRLIDKIKLINKFKTKKIILGLIIGHILIFLCVNLLTFFTLYTSKDLTSENTITNLYMAGVVTVNKIYILPIAESTSFNNPIIQPFYVVRDYLYDQGLKSFHCTNAEKALWWYKAKFLSFHQLYSLKILHKEEKREIIENYLNEMYKNLNLLSELPIKDKYLKQDRYEAFGILTYFYLNNNLNMSQNNDDYVGLYKNDKSVKKIEKLFNIFTSLRNYVQKNEKEGLIQYENSMQSYGEIISLSIITQIMAGNEYYKNFNICNSASIKLNTLTANVLFNKFYLKKANNDFNIHRKIIALRLKANNKFIFKYCKNCISKI